MRRFMLFNRDSRTPEELDALFHIVVGTADALGEHENEALTKNMAAAQHHRNANKKI